MVIGQIKDGIVLDHISAGKSIELYEILGLEKLDCSVALIKNVDSAKMGKKDIIKIGKIIDLDFAVLGYIDPGISVNYIRDGKLEKKEKLVLPDRIRGYIKCKNPRCITCCEQELVHEFKLSNREKKIYRCIYCENEAPKRTE